MTSRMLKLRAPEVVLLRRALAVYAKDWQRMLAERTDDDGKQEARERIEASDRIAEYLLKGGR